jgi:hypothetical protein
LLRAARQCAALGEQVLSIPGDFTDDLITLPLANISSTVEVCTEPDGGSGRLGIFFVLQPSPQDRNITASTVRVQAADSIINAYNFTGELLVAPAVLPRMLSTGLHEDQML